MTRTAVAHLTHLPGKIAITGNPEPPHPGVPSSIVSSIFASRSSIAAKVVQTGLVNSKNSVKLPKRRGKHRVESQLSPLAEVYPPIAFHDELANAKRFGSH